jgi:predicted ATPase
MARLSKRTTTAETSAALAAMQGLHISDTAAAKLPCFMVPYGLNLRFFGRSSELQKVREELDPTEEAGQLKAIGIHGLGGVGKSQLALQYANTSMEKYDVIAWIPADNRVNIVQALSDLARRLGLVDGGGEDNARKIQKVRDWLNTSKKNFLLIFDNVDSASVLDEIWPASPKGSVIITARSQSQASKRTATTLHLNPFSVEAGAEVLRSLTGVGQADNDDSDSVEGICRRVGGLPLAMVQLSDFIRDRGYSYAELLKIYDKSAEKVYAKSDRPVEYDHTVLTTWDISLQKLSTEARTLQNLLIFFDPDSLLERLITNTKAELEDTELSFLLDEFE